MTQKFGHRITDKFIGYSLFGLVFVGSLGRERGYTKHNTFFNILECYLAFVFGVFVGIFNIFINLINKCVSNRSFGRTAVFKPA